MAISLLPITPELDLLRAAQDLSELVRGPDNDDLVLDFRRERDIFRRSVDAACSELRLSAHCYELGEFEEFIITQPSEEDATLSKCLPRAIGIATLSIGDPKHVPEPCNPDTPNLSLFICNPHRGQGVGKTVVRKLLEIVDANFGGEAWTLIRQGNIPSQKVICDAGFMQVGEGAMPDGRTPVNYYSYNRHTRDRR